MIILVIKVEIGFVQFNNEPLHNDNHREKHLFRLYILFNIKCYKTTQQYLCYPKFDNRQISSARLIKNKKINH